MTNLRSVQVYSSNPSASPETEAIVHLFHRLDQWPKYAIPPGDLSIALLRADELAELHGTFLGDPSETDVITFPGGEDSFTSPNPQPDDQNDHPENAFAGEICVSLDRAASLPQPFNRELALYLVHGWLHLAGLGDQNPAETQAMRQAETEALQWLGEALLSTLHPSP
ncbi:MAG: rRNA maturation RNase YbeY [Puniceicoccaceae bacterium]